MKLNISIFLMFFIGPMATSCACSPEALASKDAREMNRAIERGNSNAIDRAERHREKHLSRFYNNREKYFRYAEEYKEDLY